MTFKRFMRINMILAICALLAAAACAPKVDESRIPIPADAFLYASLSDLELNWDSFVQTEFATEIPKLKIWEQPQVKMGMDGLKGAIKELEDEIGVPLNKANFMGLFGKKVDLALLPADPFPRGIIILDLGVKATAMKIMNKIKTETDKESIETLDYKKMEITRIPVEDTPGLELAYFFYGNRLILTTHADTAKTVIDCLDADVKTIFDNPGYVESGKHLGDYNNLFYLDAIRFDEVIKKVIAITGEGNYNNMFKGYTQFSAGWKWENKKMKAHSVAQIQEDSSMSKMFAGNDVMKSSAKWIPANPLAASSAAINWKKFYDFQKENLQSMGGQKGGEIWSKITDGFKEALGTELEDEVYAWGGTGGTVMFQNLNAQGMFPVPETVIGIGVSDEQKARAFMNRVEGTLTAKFADKHLQFSTREINEIEFRYIQLPLGQNLAPGYAVVNNYLLIATSPTGFTQSVNTWNGDGKSLFETPKFNEAAEADINDILAFQYMDSESVMMALAGLVDTYRMFFPEDLNPDDVKKAIETLALVRSTRTNGTRHDGWLDYSMTVNVQ